jgi:dCMP deaminase
MATQLELDHLFLDLSDRIARESKAIRSKVGAVLVVNGNIVSFGWNGTPAGMDNVCETVEPDGSLRTKPEVLHAEANVLMKLAKNGGPGAAGGTLYTTYSPCPECAKLAHQAGLKRVVYRHRYRLTNGLEMLKHLGIQCDELKEQP